MLKIKKAIVKDKFHIDTLQQQFKGKNAFVSGDLFRFYQQSEPNIKHTTVNWRIYHLVEQGVLSRVGRGKFVLGEGRIFLPENSSKTKRLYKQLHGHFPFLKICIWNTSILNEFMLHQTGRYFTLIETEKDANESVFYFLQENNYPAFLNPSSDIINRYAGGKKESFLVRPLTTEAPTQVIQGVETVTLEKMLVDIFCDENIFASQQGSEMSHIFEEAFKKYSLNENRMLRYADRKNKKEGFNTYLTKVLKFSQRL